MSLGVLPAYMLVYHAHGRCLQRPGEGVESSGPGVTDGESQCVHWELNHPKA